MSAASGYRCSGACSDWNKPPSEGEGPAKKHAEMDLHSDHHPADHRTRHRPLVETVGKEVGKKEHHAMLGQYTIFHMMFIV